MRALLVGGLMILAGPLAASECVAPRPLTLGGAVDELAPVVATTTAWAAAERVPLSVEQLLARQDYRQCVEARQLAGAGYQKRTEFDNTPYRFNMKPGEKLSAEQFDAWMASRGIRIVRAKPAEAEPATTPAVVSQ